MTKLLSYDLDGKQALDIGGNHGIYSYWLSKAVGVTGRVHVFEPQPELVEEINSVVAWLALKNVSVISTALSDKASEKTLYRSRVGDGSASLESNNIERDQSRAVTVRTSTLDDYLSTGGFSSLGYIKCDVEGHELAVIRGGISSIRALRPLIQIELRVDQPSCDQVINMLMEIGYTGSMCCDGQEVNLNDYKSVRSKAYGFEGHRDFFFEAA